MYKPVKMDCFKESTETRTEKEWMKYVQAEFKKFKKLMRKHNEKGDGIEVFDYTENMCKRRQRAVMNTLPELFRRYADISETTVGEIWTDLNMPFQSYNHIENSKHILFAASIWILDHIVDGEYPDEPEILEDNPFWFGWRKLFHYLPGNENQLEELWTTDVWDSCYDYDLITSVEYVLRKRNEPETDGLNIERVLTSEKRLTGKVDLDSESRKNYEAIVAMLPREAIEQAVDNFRNYFWQWVDRFFDQVRQFTNKATGYEDKARTMQDKYNSYVESMCSVVDRAGSLVKKPEKKLAPLAQNRLPSFDEINSFRSLSSLSKMDNLMEEAIEIAEKLDSTKNEIDEQIDKLNLLHNEFRMYMLDVARVGCTVSADEYEELKIDPMTVMQIANPYELCFALLYLIEQDDDLVWLYGAGCGFMAEVGESLPWGVYEYDELADDVWYYDADTEDNETEAAKTDAEESEEEHLEIPDWFERKYLLEDNVSPRSLAQILYEETGCILPRDLQMFNSKAKMVSKYGLDDKETAAMLTMMTTISNVRRMTSAANLEDYTTGFEAEEEDKGEEPKEDLKNEIKRLREALHAAEKGTREAKRELEKVKDEASLEHRELADLRELIFNQENTEEESIEEPSTDLFPYIVNKRTAVFGGHDTWTKAIKGLLDGNIRFVDKDLVFDVSLIRNADVIWVQANAMSHKMYYRIIDNARQWKKQVRYFAYASAEKCAEQLAAGDIK